MARRTAKQRKGEKRGAVLLVLLLVLVLLGAAMQAVPGFSAWLYGGLGIRSVPAVPDAGVQSPTAVHFVDVGQGDATLVEQNGEFALIDAGPPEGEEGLLAYMEAVGVQTLRYVFMTHPHADHIGGMEAVLRRYPSAQVLLPQLGKTAEATTSVFVGLLEAIEAEGIATETAKLGAVYPLGEGSFTVLQDGIEDEDSNMISTILLFEAEGLRYLSSGDAEKKNERLLLESGQSIQANLFKGAHHGSNTSNSKTLLRAMQPALVVVSCGEGNSYGHPHRSALESYESVQATLLRTDVNGTVVVKPDGKGTLVYATAKG